jgi:uncharacterized protein
MAKKFITKFLPNREKLEKNRFLRLLGPALFHPNLWHINRRSIAVGLAIGVFMGLIIPIAQIPFAAVIAIFMRANLPIAVASTLVTNPFTFAPIYFLAYKIGAFFLGGHDPSITRESIALEMQTENVGAGMEGWIDKIADLGGPLMLGLGIMATSGAILAYLAVRLIWRLQVTIKLRKKRRAPVEK